MYINWNVSINGHSISYDDNSSTSISYIESEIRWLSNHNANITAKSLFISDTPTWIFPDPSLSNIGCSNTSKSLSNSHPVINNTIYACAGIIESGGVYGPDAAALCNSRYHVCESANETKALGLTQLMCYNVAGNHKEFFATKETSAGSWQCHSYYDHIANTKKRNDIWGCATLIATETVPGFDDALFQRYDCDPLIAVLSTEFDWYYWKISTNQSKPAATYSLTNSSSGGVLCCVDS